MPKLKIADYFPSISSLDSITVNNFALAHESSCITWNHQKDYAKKGMNGWLLNLKYIVMDGCMLLNKSSTISENCKERKRQVVLYQNSDL